MKSLPWEAKAAKREVAEAALRKAIEHVEDARRVGGPREHGQSTSYRTALHLIRLAEAQLRLSERA